MIKFKSPPLHNLRPISYWQNSSTEWSTIPDSKVHGANMGSPGSCRPQMGPMLAPWTLLSGMWNNNVATTLSNWTIWSAFENNCVILRATMVNLILSSPRSSEIIDGVKLIKQRNTPVWCWIFLNVFIFSVNNIHCCTKWLIYTK